MEKKAFITGITGQDGAYLAHFLLDKGYEVWGLKRQSSSFSTERIDPLIEQYNLRSKQLNLVYGDMTDSTNFIANIQHIMPDKAYNLAAQSHVKMSFETPEYTANADGLGTLRILEAIRISGLENKTRFYQASTSEMYGLAQETPQRETMPFYPRSPYGVAKLYAYWITVNYIVGAKLCEYITKTISFSYKTIIPCNLFGKKDSYSHKKSHLAAAAIRKIYEAVKSNAPSTDIWGDGKARREFMYV